MTSLTVPPPVVAGLSKITGLSEESFQELLTFLEAIPLRIRDAVIFDDSDGDLQTITSDDFASLKQAIYSLFVGKTATNLSLERFIEDILGYLEKERDRDAEWIKAEGSKEVLEERLRKILSIKTLNTLAKTYELLTENVHTFSSARILSDIRPVFGDDVANQPTAAVIVHTLNVAYMDGDSRKEFCVALDSNDLQSLGETLKRAEEKGKTLSGLVSNTGMDIIEFS